MITKEDIKTTEFQKAKKRTWIWSDDYYIQHINPKYGYFLYCTLHVPTEIWAKSAGKNDISNIMSKIILHRYYNIEDPTSNWDWSFENGESEVVYKGFIHSKDHLDTLLLDLGINEK